MRIDLIAVKEGMAQRDCTPCGEQAAGETSGRDGELTRVRVPEREQEPRADSSAELERSQRDQRQARQKTHCGAGEGESSDADSGGEDDVEGVRQLHLPQW